MTKKKFSPSLFFLLLLLTVAAVVLLGFYILRNI